jgi:uncharacterized membrane protein YhdT
VPSRSAPRPSTVQLGLAVFVVGLAFVAADVIPYFFSAHDRPLWLNLACLLAPLGFAVAVSSGLRRGRAAQREAVRELDGG